MNAGVVRISGCDRVADARKHVMVEDVGAGGRALKVVAAGPTLDRGEDILSVLASPSWSGKNNGLRQGREAGDGESRA